MHAAMRISGHRPTTAILPTSLRSRARLPRLSPTSYRPNFLRVRRKPSSRRLPLMLSPSISTAGQRTSFLTPVSARSLHRTCAWESICSIKRLRGILLSSPRSASSLTLTIDFTICSTTLLSGAHQRKRRLRRRSGSSPMPGKHTWPAPAIFTLHISITTGRWLNLKWPAAQCLILLGSSS